MAVVFRFQKFSASGLVSQGAFNVFQTSATEHMTIKNWLIGFFGAGSIFLDIHIFPTTGGPLPTNKLVGQLSIFGGPQPPPDFKMQNVVVPPSHFLQYRYVRQSFFTPGNSAINTWVSGVLTTDQP